MSHCEHGPDFHRCGICTVPRSRLAAVEDELTAAKARIAVYEGALRLAEEALSDTQDGESTVGQIHEALEACYAVPPGEVS